MNEAIAAPAPQADDARLAAQPGWLEGGIAVLTAGGEISGINPALADWLGQPANACLGRPLTEVLGKRIPEWESLLEEWAARAAPFEQFHLCGAGAEPKPWFNFESARGGGAVFVRLNSILPPLAELAEGAWDEQLRGEAAQRSLYVRMLRAEARLHNLLHHWPGVIFSQRADFSFSFISPQIEELTGVPVNAWARQARLFWEVIHEADGEEVRRQLQEIGRTRRNSTCTYRIRHLTTGRVSYILEHRQPVLTHDGLILGYEGVWLDVTRQTIAEKRLATASWKEALAVLTAGLAHDFGNVMAGIHSLSDTCATQLDPQHPAQELLALVKTNALQANQLVQRISRLHHGKVGERSYEDLNALVKDLEDLIRKIVSRRIQVSLSLADGQLPVYLDAVEFRQVLINLALNAAEAMPGGGQLRLETALWEAPPPLHLACGAPPRPPAVCLAVMDTGHGIKTAHLPAIFDPFFSTKTANKGSGLGLYNARLFIERHHGGISVETLEHQGTTFRLWLPRSDFTEAERDQMPAQTQRILVAGPNASAVEGTAELLRQQGFAAVTALANDRARRMLEAGTLKFAAVLVLRSAGDLSFEALLSWVRQYQTAVKTIVQFVGCNQDEVDGHLLHQADLVLPPDLPPAELPARLAALLNPPARSDHE